MTDNVRQDLDLAGYVVPMPEGAGSGVVRARKMDPAMTGPEEFYVACYRLGTGVGVIGISAIEAVAYELHALWLVDVGNDAFSPEALRDLNQRMDQAAWTDEESSVVRAWLREQTGDPNLTHAGFKAAIVAHIDMARALKLGRMRVQ